MIKLPALFAVKDAEGFLKAAAEVGRRSVFMAEEVIKVGTFRVETTAEAYFARDDQYLYDTKIAYGCGTIGIRECELQFFEVVSDE